MASFFCHDMCSDGLRDVFPPEFVHIGRLSAVVLPRFGPYFRIIYVLSVTWSGDLFEHWPSEHILVSPHHTAFHFNVNSMLTCYNAVDFFLTITYIKR